MIIVLNPVNCLPAVRLLLRSAEKKEMLGQKIFHNNSIVKNED